MLVLWWRSLASRAGGPRSRRAAAGATSGASTGCLCSWRQRGASQSAGRRGTTRWQATTRGRRPTCRDRTTSTGAGSRRARRRRLRRARSRRASRRASRRVGCSRTRSVSPAKATLTFCNIEFDFPNCACTSGFLLGLYVTSPLRRFSDLVAAYPDIFGWPMRMQT